MCKSMKLSASYCCNLRLVSFKYIGYIALNGGMIFNDKHLKRFGKKT
jgi:hypothetical protein